MLCPDPIACDYDPVEHTGPADHRGQGVGWIHGVPPAGMAGEPHGRSHVPQSGVPACEDQHLRTGCDREESRYDIPEGCDTLESQESMGAIHPGPMLTGAQLWGECPGPKPENSCSSAMLNPSYRGWEEDTQNPVETGRCRYVPEVW